jgi:hypothetical protein
MVSVPSRRSLDKGRRLCATVAILSLSQLSLAYDADVHYWFTYFAARVTGFTDDQSVRIALADQSVDNLNSKTNPVPCLESILDLSIGDLFVQDQARLLFHAFFDDRKDFSMYDAVERRSLTLFDRREAINITEPLPRYSDLDQINVRTRQLDSWCRSHGNNPGVLLHYLQDQYSHAGYGVTFGQAVGKSKLGVGVPAHPLVLPGGTITDFLGFDQRTWGKSLGIEYRKWLWYPAEGDRDTLMVRRTLLTLKKYADYCNIATDPSISPESSCLALVARLKAANPIQSYINPMIQKVKQFLKDYPGVRPRVYGELDHDDSQYGKIVSEELNRIGMVSLFRKRPETPSIIAGIPSMYAYEFSSIEDLKVVSGSNGEAVAGDGADAPKSPMDTFDILGSVTVGVHAIKSSASESSKNMASSSNSGLYGSSKSGFDPYASKSTTASGLYAQKSQSTWIPYGSAKPSGWSPFDVRDYRFTGGNYTVVPKGERDLLDPLRSRMAMAWKKGNHRRTPRSVVLWVPRDVVISLGNSQGLESKPKICWRSQKKDVISKGADYFEAQFDRVPVGVMLIAEITYDDGSLGASTVVQHRRQSSYDITAIQHRLSP